LNIASNEVQNGASSFQTIIDINELHGAIVLMLYAWIHQAVPELCILITRRLKKLLKQAEVLQGNAL